MASPFEGKYSDVSCARYEINQFDRVDITIIMKNGLKYKYTIGLGNDRHFSIMLYFTTYKRKRLTVMWADDEEDVKKEIDIIIKYCERRS